MSFREDSLKGAGTFSLGIESQLQASPRGGRQRMNALTSPPALPDVLLGSPLAKLKRKPEGTGPIHVVHTRQLPRAESRVAKGRKGVWRSELQTPAHSIDLESQVYSLLCSSPRQRSPPLHPSKSAVWPRHQRTAIAFILLSSRPTSAVFQMALVGLSFLDPILLRGVEGCEQKHR